MPKFILFVHGYSETSLGAYYEFPTILSASVPAPQPKVGLSAFDSLDDSISVTELADAMETRVEQLELQGWVTSDSAIICHSTGAIIARRWILNRLAAGKPIPSHFISMAGANHGSTLALMGKSVLGYLQKMIQKHILTVGAQVLTDLEYGSDFLLRLNAEWLDAWNGGQLDRIFAFSMGGDSIGTDPTLQIFWQTHESGSDNTVRICGANLNYTMISASASAPDHVVAIVPKRRIPHAVLQGYSHFGPDTGILGNVHGPGDAPMAKVLDALKVSDDADYAACEKEWSDLTAGWTTANPNSANSMGIFTILDQRDQSIDDCMIAILDQTALGVQSNAIDPASIAARITALNNVSSCVLPHSPIQNDTQRGSYAFYLNFNEYLKSSPHWYHIEVHSASESSTNYPLKALTFTQPPDLKHTIAPNEVTYVKLTLDRDSDPAYNVYGWSEELNLDSITWPPFREEGRIAPPSPGSED